MITGISSFPNSRKIIGRSGEDARVDRGGRRERDLTCAWQILRAAITVQNPATAGLEVQSSPAAQ